jgi:hypothetical protein
MACIGGCNRPRQQTKTNSPRAPLGRASHDYGLSLISLTAT